MLPYAEIELEASRALYAARMLVTSIHSAGPWEMRWGTVTVPATKEFTETGVRFSATFPDLCWLERPEGGVLLLLDGEIMGVRRVDDPGDTEFVITWEYDVRVGERL